MNRAIFRTSQIALHWSNPSDWIVICLHICKLNTIDLIHLIAYHFKWYFALDLFLTHYKLHYHWSNPSWLHYHFERCFALDLILRNPWSNSIWLNRAILSDQIELCLHIANRFTIDRIHPAWLHYHFERYFVFGSIFAHCITIYLIHLIEQSYFWHIANCITIDLEPFLANCQLHYHWSNPSWLK